jgi:branched-chain amino acid aminotransferase
MDGILVWHWSRSKEKLEQYACKSGQSTNEIGAQLPSGVYTTMRTYQRTKVLRLSSHLGRLLESARLSGISLDFDEALLRYILRIAINSTHIKSDIKIKIHIDLTQSMGDIFLMLEPLVLPEESELRQGGVAISRVMHRDNPLIKASGFISTADTLRILLPHGINEVLMIGEDGGILEGLSSNFFAVRDHEVWTAAEGVLAGITRTLVLASINDLGIPLKKSTYPVEQVNLLDEAFITSTSRGVLSIRRIDNCEIGTICPGETTIRIRDDFERRVNEEIEEV